MRKLSYLLLVVGALTACGKQTNKGSSSTSGTSTSHGSSSGSTGSHASSSTGHSSSSTSTGSSSSSTSGSSSGSGTTASSSTGTASTGATSTGSTSAGSTGSTSAGSTSNASSTGSSSASTSAGSTGSTASGSTSTTASTGTSGPGSTSSTASGSTSGSTGTSASGSTAGASTGSTSTGAGSTGSTGGASTGSTGSTGATGGCITALDCPGTDTDCVHRACVNLVCVPAFTQDGTPIANQNPGDCQRLECDGQGHVVSREDDNDVPTSSSNCGSGACINGAPTTLSVDAGSACAQNGGTVCNGSGTCVQCLGPNDCPGGDGDCAVRTCTNGICGFSFTPVGQPLGTQIPGDCRQAQCDGDGGTLSVPDDGDLPVDGNTCTTDVCLNGVPSHSATNAGGACGADGGMLCNNNGQCVGCLTVADCPGSDTECAFRVCDSSGTCAYQNVAVGTPTPNQTPGDCQARVCDGDGGATSVPANSDVPDDSNPCTDDLCTNGVPSHSSVLAGTSCGGGMLCDGSGKCVGCLQPTDCPATANECIFNTCINNTCGTGFTVDGTPTSNQASGDCQRNECDGQGHIVSRADNTDVPADDGKACTSETCVAGAPQHPSLPSGTACSQNSGVVCDGNGTCVQCVTPSNCGTDTACQSHTCNAGTCGVANAPAGTFVSNPTPGDCRSNLCDGNGGVTTNAVDNTDVPADDNNQCTGETCVAGTPQHPNKPQGTACNQNGGVACNASGACVQCQVNSDCGTDTACKAFTCNSGACSTDNAPAGTFVSNPTTGDCHSNKCDGSGNIVSAVDDTDVPVDSNACTSDVCTNGVPSNPALPLGTSCGSGMVCDASARCVGCILDSDCPAPSNECLVAVCNAGTCGTTPVSAGTATSSQTTGDCHKNTCDGNGNIVNAVDDTDLPTDDGNPCTSETCNAGVPSHPNLPALTACSQNGGVVCDGSGTCTNSVMVVRVGDGSAALTNAATATFIEERFVSNGALTPTGHNPLAMPTAVSGSNARLTLSGSAAGEGALALSGDGHYVTLAGYDASTGTGNVSTSASATVNRIAGRIDASGNIDTSTKISNLINANGVRSAVTNDGTQFWFGGAVSGVVYATLGATTGTAILASTNTPTNVRWVEIYAGQLYGSSGSGAFVNVFKVGTGLPTTTGQPVASQPGMPTSGSSSPYGYAFVGSNVMYVADDRTQSNGGGVQKWTLNAGTWSLKTTFQTGNGARGVAAFVTGSTVTVVATTTAASANTLVTFIDDGVTLTPTPTIISTAAANTVYRGVAASPR